MEISSEILETYFTEVHFKKDEFLTEIGSVEKWLYYIDEGIIRFFYYNPTTQKETTVDICSTGDFCMSYASFVKQEPSLLSMQAIKKVKAYRIGRDSLEKLIESPEFLQIKTQILENLLLEKMHREAQFLTQSPGELIQNVPLKYIASYIGVTPQALSRIRKRIF